MPHRRVRRRIGALYERHFRHHRRSERQFLASLSFFVTFGVTRLVTHAMRAGRGPFRAVAVGDIHVHHLVFGILILLGVGYAWLLRVGSGADRTSVVASRVTALLYGVGAALTLDEYALWLNLRDVYWERQGRTSVEAVAMFGALISASFWGAPFLRALARHGRTLLRPGVRE